MKPGRIAAAVVIALAVGAIAAPRDPFTLDRAAERWVGETLKQLTTDEKIGQLIVASFESSGTVAAPSFLDGGQHQMSWHRLYVEAVLPQGCGVQIDLAASDDPNFAPSNDDWHPHFFGDIRTAEAELARPNWQATIAGSRCRSRPACRRRRRTP